MKKCSVANTKKRNTYYLLPYFSSDTSLVFNFSFHRFYFRFAPYLDAGGNQQRKHPYFLLPHLYPRKWSGRARLRSMKSPAIERPNRFEVNWKCSRLFLFFICTNKTTKWRESGTNKRFNFYGRAFTISTSGGKFRTFSKESTAALFEHSSNQIARFLGPCVVSITYFYDYCDRNHS